MRTHEEIYNAYEKEVLNIMPELEAWWKTVLKIRRGDTDGNERWIFGLCGHPRFIEIFRRYFIEILQVNRQFEEPDDGDEIDLEELWHMPTGEEGDEAGPIPPRDLLIDDLIRNNPELDEHFRLFMFIPIGIQDSIDVYGEG